MPNFSQIIASLIITLLALIVLAVPYLAFVLIRLIAF